MIRCEAHKETNSYDIQWDGSLFDLFEEIAVLLYAIHQESGMEWERLFRDLKKVCLAAFEVTQEKEGE